MKLITMVSAIGFSITLLVPNIVMAQTAASTAAKRPARRSTRSAPRRETPTEGIRRSGLPPGFLSQNDGGNRFTDSTMRGMTRAGTLGVETGTFGSDSNGQIGTTNQNNMVHYPLSDQGSLLTFHFGSGAKQSAPLRAHRSPRSAEQDRNK